MSRFHSHINSLRKILDGYDRKSPFSLHLKSFFAGDKKYGSRDRKSISRYAYIFFRTSRLLGEEDLAEMVIKGLFLCANQPQEELSQELNAHIEEEIDKKMARLGVSGQNLFPYKDLLSKEIDAAAFSLSLLSQPSVFIRLRPGNEISVRQTLKNSEIVFEEIQSDCLSVQQGADLSALLQLDSEAVIQDLNSQKVFDFLKEYPLPMGALSVWDCCAGSGGKSILFHDRSGGNCAITMSDVRPGILANLSKRMALAGIKPAAMLEIDLRSPVKTSHPFSLIICDVPCTGSGTWSRTPEQCFYFEAEKIKAFVQSQRIIVDNAIPSLKEGGLFFYITCSAFRDENEGMVEYIESSHSLKRLHKEYLKGYSSHADTMFVAVFEK